MAQKNRSERKNFGPSRHKVGMYGAGKNKNEESGSYSAANKTFHEDDREDDADDLLHRAFNEKRAQFKKPPKPAYESWNLPEENSISKVNSHVGKGPKGYRRSDERIREEVCEALAAHPEIDASEMEVDVEDGVVIFRGSVESRLVKRMAEDLVENMTGVVDVKNELHFMNHQGSIKGNGKKNKNHESHGK